MRRALLLLSLAALLGPASVVLAQEGGSDLGAPPPREGADTIAPSTGPTTPTYGVTPVTPPAGELPPGSEAPPHDGDVPAPPDELPSAYDGSAGPGRDNRYPTGERSEEGVRVPSRIATRLRVLDANFTTLSNRGGSGLVDGILSIVTGGLSITLGIIVDDNLLSPYLYVYGGAGVARGVIDIALTPDPSEPTITFAHMPMGTMQEVRARLEYGERELESLADRKRVARILDASISIGAGVAIVPIYLGPKDFEIDEFGAFVMIGAGISVVSGVINLLSSSEAERRWAAYQELRARLGRGADEAQQDAPAVRFAASPLPGGGAFTLTGSF